MLDKRSKTWNFFWWENGRRRSKKVGTKAEYPTRSAAWKAAQPLRIAAENRAAAVAPEPAKPKTPTLNTLTETYRMERMPKRLDTRRSYEVWLTNYIVPKWGEYAITDVQPRPVELWLESLSLAPKTKADIRGLLRVLFDYAMWSGQLQIGRNPIELVRVKDATKRTKEPRSLTPAEFQQFITNLSEPFRTIALVSVCLGLRISECLGLRWSDINWLESKVTIQRGVVNGHEDDVKTVGSRKPQCLSPEVLSVLQQWRVRSEFAKESDYIFASPISQGQKPWSSYSVRRQYIKAAKAGGVATFGTHSLRHTFRSWLDATGTPISVQQRAMRHSSIKVTMDRYGSIITDELTQAFDNVARLATNGR